MSDDAAAHPRSCLVRKWPDFQGFGFNLHAERGRAGQYIGKVDDDSPAQAAGLKEGDRIVEVNGTNIGNENHQQVVSRIKEGGDEVTLLVLDNEADKYFKDEKIVVRTDMPEVIRLETPPRPGQETEEFPAPPDVPPVENEAEPEQRTPTPPPEPEPEPEPEVTVTNTYIPENAEPEPEPSPYHPRLCHIIKWPDFQGYGFNLHAEREKSGQYIGKIDANSPAETADLREGDRIVEVNGDNIESDTHAEVIQKIKAGGDETKMLVVDKEADNYYKARGITVTSDMPEVIRTSSSRRSSTGPTTNVTQIDVSTPEPTPVVNNIEPEPSESPYHPRLCHVVKWTTFQGYGFNLHAEKEQGGQYIGKIDNGSPAEAAGLQEGDRIIAVNGDNIERETHHEVINKIKAGGDQTKMLVVDKAADEYYKSKGITVNENMPEVITITSQGKEPGSVQTNATVAPVAERAPSPYNPRQCHIVKWASFQGYGFNLHADKEGRQFIGKIDAGSPSEAAGVKEGDRIVAVNGKSVENDTHQEVIEKIKAGGNQTSLLVVDRNADEYYKNNGITITGDMPEVKYMTSEGKEPALGTVTNTYNGSAPSEAEPVKSYQPEPAKPAAQANGNLLDMNLSAKEMRERLQSKKKQDAKQKNMDFRSKYEIFQKM